MCCWSVHRYEVTSKDVTKWQAQVKANREAPTLDLTKQQREGPKGPNSLASLAAAFKPQSAMEQEIAAMLQAAGAGSDQQVEAAEEALVAQVCVKREGGRRRRSCQLHSVLQGGGRGKHGPPMG